MDSTGAAAAGADAGPGSYAIPSYNTHNLKLDPSIRDWGKKLKRALHAFCILLCGT